MSLIGLLTATDKQVWLGRLHMRLIQGFMDFLAPEKPLEDPRISGQIDSTTALPTPTSEVVVRAQKRAIGSTSPPRGHWSMPESHWHIDLLELKAVL